MALTKPKLTNLSGKRAPRYDLSANLYGLLGFREWAYRKKAVRALGLDAGDSVVEIGCGTGLSFGLLREAAGPEGRIVGAISSFVLTLVPEYDEVIRRGAAALRPGARRLLPPFCPCGVTADLADRHPWESLERHLSRFGMEEHYFGFTYVAWGEK